jgi:NTP pyrophosphatase (non-canonical NTP hydrolase)
VTLSAEQTETDLEALQELVTKQSESIRNLEVLLQRFESPILMAVAQEWKNATEKWPVFNSAHEGFAVLLEEMDELWDHVRTNQKNRDLNAMKREAIQVAAMGLRFATEVCDDERGRK